MNAFKIIFLITVMSFISCSKEEKTKTDCWETLIQLDIKQSEIDFQNRINADTTDKLSLLGLAYSQCALNNEEWYNSINDFTSNPDSALIYGFIAQAFKSFSKGIDNPEFNINEFRALHLDGKFKVKRNFQIVEGEYKNLKPVGIWKFYNMNNDLIREQNMNDK